MLRNLIGPALLLLLAVCAVTAEHSPAAQVAGVTYQSPEDQLPPTYVPPGKQTYKEYCAACHGFDGKGRGPAASSLNRQPPNLTTLAKRQGGSFPMNTSKVSCCLVRVFPPTAPMKCRYGIRYSDTSKTIMRAQCASGSRI